MPNFLCCAAMKKEELRKIYLQKRRQMTLEERAIKSERIARRFFEQVYSEKFAAIHIFLPIAKFNEIDTWMIVDELRARKSTTRIAISRSDLQSGRMINYFFNPATRLVENKWGIPEPESGEICDALAVDAVLVPLLAFDKKGRRVGYGKGFYDRFLGECRRDSLKIGLSFEPPVEAIDDPGAHDVLLDMAVTPDGIYYF